MPVNALYLVLLIMWIRTPVVEGRGRRINYSTRKDLNDQLKAKKHMDKLKNRIIDQIQGRQNLGKNSPPEFRDLPPRLIPEPPSPNAVHQSRPLTESSSDDCRTEDSSFQIFPQEGRASSSSTAVFFDLSLQDKPFNISEIANIELVVYLRPAKRKKKRQQSRNDASNAISAKKTQPPSASKSGTVSKDNDIKRSPVLSRKTRSFADQINALRAGRVPIRADPGDSRSKTILETFNKLRVDHRNNRADQPSLPSLTKEVKPEIKSKRRKNRKHRGKRRRKGKKVKIVVRSLNPKTGKKIKRATSTKKNFKRRAAVTIPLPKFLLQPEYITQNKTLTLYITCKKCGVNVRMENVYHSKKGKGSKKKKNSKKLANQPHLVVKRKQECSRLRRSIDSLGRSIDSSRRHLDSSWRNKDSSRRSLDSSRRSKDSSRVVVVRPKAVLRHLFRRSKTHHVIKSNMFKNLQTNHELRSR